jgi:hypothetical protein
MAEMRTASGPRFSRPSAATDLNAELEQIRTAPGAVERARHTVRQALPRTRPFRHRVQLAVARLWRAKGSLAGLTMLDVAAFQLGTVSGLIATGISCFVAEWVAR